MDRVAASLQRDGCKPGDTIAICALANNAYIVLFMGALRAGLAVAPLAPSSTPAQIAGMTADAGARHLFLDAANAQAVPAALTGPGVQRIRLDDASAARAKAAPATPRCRTGWRRPAAGRSR
jgi:long-chain acyl-CoA synthetase